MHIHHACDISRPQVGHCHSRSHHVAVQKRLFPRSPHQDSQNLTPELHEVNGLFQLASHTRDKNPHYQGTEGRNAGTPLR